MIETICQSFHNSSIRAHATKLDFLFFIPVEQDLSSLGNRNCRPLGIGLVVPTEQDCLLLGNRTFRPKRTGLSSLGNKTFRPHGIGLFVPTE